MPIAFQSGETRKKPKLSKRKQVEKAIDDFTRMYGPKAGAGPTSTAKTVRQARKTTPSRAKERAAVARATREFMRTHGPIGQRTSAAVRTPWQKLTRAERRGQRASGEAFAAAVNPEAVLFGATKGYEAGFNKSVQAYERAHGPRGYPTSSIGVQANLPGVDPQIARAALLTTEQRAARNQRIEDQKEAIRNQIASGKTDEAQGRAKIERLATQQLINSNASIVGGGIGRYIALPGLAAQQVAEALLYTPAFAWQMYEDPIGTLKKIPGAVLEDFRHPLRNPGYLVMDLIGLKGIAGGVIGKSNALRGARTPGDVLRTVVRPLDRGMREVAPGAFRLNPRNVAAIPVGKILRGAKRLTPKDSPLERAATAIEKRNIGRLRAATRRTETEMSMDAARGLQKEAKGGKHTLVEDIAIRAVENNVKPSALARLWRDTLEKGKRLPSGKRRPITSKAQKRRLNDLIAAAEEVGRRGLVIVDDAGDARINPSETRLAALEQRAFRSSQRTTERKLAVHEETGGRFGISPEVADSATNRIADIVAEDLGGEARPGRAFVSDTSGRRVSLNPRINVSGLSFPQPRYPFSRARKTGSAAREGTFDPRTVDVIAREELGTARYQERYAAHQQQLRDAVSPTDLYDLYEAGKVTERDLARYWRLVRVGNGKMSPAAKAITEKALRNDGRIPLREFKELAEDATAKDLIGFFDRRSSGIPDVEVGYGPGETILRKTVDPISRAARFLLLSTKGPGFVLPNAIGVSLMTLIGQGVFGALDTGLALARGVGRGLTREQAARWRTLSGAGAARSIIKGEEGNVLGRGANRLADFYAKFTDDWARAMGVVYEARNKGYRTPGDFQRFLSAEKGTKEWRDSIEVQKRVDRMYGAFRMSDFERRTIGRLIFFWPWIRASSIYAAQLPMEHPIKSAALVQGGRVAREEVENQLGGAIVALLTERGGPGTFQVGTTDDGRPIVINPQSAAILQGPFDFISLITNPEPFKKLLAMGTPAIEFGGASVGYNTFFGDMFQEDLNLGERIGATALGYVPGVTAYQRISGDTIIGEPSKNPLYDYTTGQALSAAVGAGSITPRTLNRENALEKIEAQYRAEHPNPPEPRAYERDYQWVVNSGKVTSAEGKANVEAWKRGEDLIRYGRVKLARQLGLVLADGETPSVSKLNDRQEYRVRIGVLNMVRPGFLPADFRKQYQGVWESGDEDAIDRLKRAINEGLSFSDVYGASIETRIKQLQEEAK